MNAKTTTAILTCGLSRVPWRRTFRATNTTISWAIALVTVGYMLPWAVARSRGKSNSGAIGLLNLLLGWCLIGWVVALVMACGEKRA